MKRIGGAREKMSVIERDVQRTPFVAKHESKIAERKTHQDEMRTKLKWLLTETFSQFNLLSYTHVRPLFTLYQRS